MQKAHPPAGKPNDMIINALVAEKSGNQEKFSPREERYSENMESSYTGNRSVAGRFETL